MLVIQSANHDPGWPRTRARADAASAQNGPGRGDRPGRLPDAADHPGCPGRRVVAGWAVPHPAAFYIDPGPGERAGDALRDVPPGALGCTEAADAIQPTNRSAGETRR